MYIPPYLYFEPKQIKAQLSTQFTGDLDVSAAMQNNPRCWRRQDIAGVKHKKTIVLSDFRFETFDPKKKLLLKNTIDNLLEEGFTIYLWQSEGPFELTQNNIGIIDNDSIFLDCPPVHPKDIVKTMAKKQIAQEALLVMNLKDMETLANEMKEEKSLSRSKELEEVLLTDVLESKYSWDEIKQAIPNLQLIESTANPSDDKKKTWWVKNHEEPIKFDYSYFVVYDEDTFGQFQDKAVDVKTLVIGKPSRQFPNVIVDKTRVSFRELLENNPHIDTIKVNGLNLKNLYFEVDLNEQSGPFENIEILDLSDIPNIIQESGEYRKLIDIAHRCMPNLKKIITSNPNNVKGQLLALEKGTLEQTDLSELRINGDHLDKMAVSVNKFEKLPTQILKLTNFELDNPFINVIKKMQKINYLVLENFEGSPDVLFELRKISSLKKMRIEFDKSFNEKGKALEGFLQIAPNLDVLDIKNCSYADFPFYLSFERLATLNFQSKIDDFGNFLLGISKFAPHLNTLNITIEKGGKASEGLTDKTISILPKSFFLLHLKELMIDRLPPAELKSLLKLSPNLESLGLNRCDPSVIFLANNKYIKSLRVALPTNDKEFTLANLLNQLPDLEEFAFLTSPSTEFYSPQKLPEVLKLKKLNLSNFNDPSLLADVLLRSPDLTELKVENLIGSSELLKKLVKEGAQFLKLKSISLEYSDLTLEGYKLLKLIAPNLTILDINGCKIGNLPEETEIFVNKSTFIEIPQISGKNVHEKTHQIDANTGLDKIEYKVQKVFTDLLGNTYPAVNYYRNSVFNTLNLSDDPSHPFKLSNEGDLQLEPYKNYTYGAVSLTDLITEENKKTASSLLLGKHTMDLSQEWSTLPSASATEILKAIHVNGMAENEIEIQYSKRDNLYYIRKMSPGSARVKIDYAIDPNKHDTKPSHAIAEWVAHYNTFGSGELGDTKGLSAEKLLTKMFMKKVGRCVQRATVFKYFMQKQYPGLAIRIVNNDCHSFVEVMEDGKWMSFCLGGYPANIKAQEPEATHLGETLEGIVTPLVRKPIKGAKELLVPPNPLHITWQQKGVAQIEADTLTLQALSATAIDSKTGEQQGKNVLIQCESDSDVQTLSLNLQHIAKHSGRPFFVIDHPEQIACKSSWLKREADNTGVSIKGPGGPLHTFLTEHGSATQPPVLIVNWNNFSADELVRFNTLIDEIRIADDTPLPKNMVVAGVYNTKKGDAYTGSDFYSRMQLKLGVDSNTIPHQRFDFTIPLGSKTSEAVDIELYDSVNWKYILLGQWTLEAGKLVFKEGELTQALMQGKSVHLKNAPWHLTEFKQFWQEAKIKESITVEGNTIPIPKEFWGQLNQSEGYDWGSLVKDLQFLQNLTELQPPFVVNTDNFKQWVDHYDLHEGKPIATTSLFSKYENQRVDLLISEALSAASWHQLLKEANRWKINLRIALPEGLDLPPSLAKAIPVTYLKEKIRSVKQVQLISTNDVSMSLAQIKSELGSEKPLVIDISECTPSEVFYRATADFKEDKIEFSEKWSDVFKGLQNKRTVILKGHFSPEMINAILPLSVQGGMMVNGELHSFEGKLILLSDQVLSEALLREQRTHSLHEKINWILDNMPVSAEVSKAIKEHSWPENFSLAQIQGAILHYLRSSPPSFQLHEGILKVTTTPTPSSTLDLDDEHVNSVCEKFVNERMSELRNILVSSPFAFIGGKTGVGKSTFISKYLTPENGFKLYNEMTDLVSWALDDSPGVKVLFLDEANIADKDYTLFEGLYENPPKILVNNTLIPLTPEHKVILAGNPMSYGGERHLPRLLAEHGNACQFDPLPVEYVYREILKPIFAAANVSLEQARNFSQVILKTYQYICANSQEEILISPRELKMMAMMIASSAHKEQQSSSIIYEVAKQCLPPEKKNDFHQWFASQYSEVLTAHFVPPPKIMTSGKKFILTPSREPIYQSLQRLLNVRELTQQSDDENLQSPGLGGMLLEGEPGSGKSHFLIDALLQQKYEKISLDKVDAMNENPIKKGFYVIPASLAHAEKKRILLAAFDQGIPVVIDEINSGPMMEQLLNSLLMGINPDTKKGPTHPGFLLLATQNPISMAGRQATSRAISRRLMFYEFPAYKEKEMKMILTESFPNIEPTVLDEHIKYHVEAINYAKTHHLEPVPVFRDLNHIVHNIDLSHQAKPGLHADIHVPKTHIEVPQEKRPEPIRFDHKKTTEMGRDPSNVIKKEDHKIKPN